jgi:hypothetical protein
MPNVSIAISEITSVGKEVSDPGTLARMNRPFRRICINAGPKGARKTIDVSLKPFWQKDISIADDNYSSSTAGRRYAEELAVVSRACHKRTSG